MLSHVVLVTCAVASVVHMSSASPKRAQFSSSNSVLQSLPLSSYECRCVADQWQAILASSDREFDLRGGRTGVMENQVYVSYDYRNKKFAMTDLTSGNRAIADYGQGFKYVVRPDGCSQIGTAEMMKQMCLPDHAEYGGEFRLGLTLPVDMWMFTAQYNMTMKTTVQRKNCLPVTEEVFMSQGSYASLTSSMYLDVTLGIKDRSVFDPPANCVFNAYRSRMNTHPEMVPQQKRADGLWGMLHMLRTEQQKN